MGSGPSSGLAPIPQYRMIPRERMIMQDKSPLESTPGAFRIHLIGVVRNLYGLYMSERERNDYVARVALMPGTWEDKTEALHKAYMANDQVPLHSDLEKILNPFYKQVPPKRPMKHSHIYGDDPRQQIIDVLAINEFRGIYGELQREHRQGKYVRGCCPIHKGKKQSFGYNTQTGSWQCFSRCGGGTVFDFEMAMGGESFVQVLERLTLSLGLESSVPTGANEKLGFGKEPCHVAKN